MATPLDLVLYVGLPYVALALFVLVPIYRRMTRDIDWDWTTRASGIFDNRGIGLASLLLHWGLLFVLAGHLVGFAGAWFAMPFLVDVFFWVGAVGGIAALVGSVMAVYRRLVNPRMRAMSTLEDYLVHVFLIAILSLALYESLVLGAFGVSMTVGHWFLSLFTLSPNVSSVAGAPLAVRVHIIVTMLFWAYFPFTKLVHLFSAPVGYLVRPYI
ncbi:MAG: respiratory nitrate reductase subunit gamma, partial [Halodesulfurarchaeum sp.]